MKRIALSVLLLAVVGMTGCGDDQPTQPAVEVPEWTHVAPEQIAEAKKHGVPVAFENDLGMRFVLIPAGTFTMGSPEDEEGRDDDEVQHRVTITKPYYMQITEVTNRQYKQFKASHASSAGGESLDRNDQPAVRVSLADCEEFAAWLGERDASRTYRLPTEAKWEYACRAGTTTRFWWGNAVSDGGNKAHFKVLAEDSNAPRNLPVASHAPNPWGLYDMHGNVAEWVGDWYGPYGADAVADPLGPTTGRRRLLRGGHSKIPKYYMGAASRDDAPVSYAKQGGVNDGFRFASPLPEPKGGK